MERYWGQVLVEMGDASGFSIDHPMDPEATLGHSLAQAVVRAPKSLKGISQDTAEHQAYLEGLEWIRTHLNKQEMPPEFHRIIDQYEQALQTSRLTKDLWDSFPREVRETMNGQQS